MAHITALQIFDEVVHDEMARHLGLPKPGMLDWLLPWRAYAWQRRARRILAEREAQWVNRAIQVATDQQVTGLRPPYPSECK